ncbi:MAG: hypothetical protein JXA54_01250 [Candidatus Heimdallarchaeota archaeon]|nr:hypothetical protein [Candidatus Heimdallarchaeota archaeon]
MKEKIDLLKSQIDKLKRIQRTELGLSESGVNAWISATNSIFERIFGKENIKIKELENIKNSLMCNLSGPSFYTKEDVEITGETIIQAAIDEIEKLGIPSTIYDGKKESINLTMIQQQLSSQTLNIDIITNALQDELTGSQLKELQDILDSEEDKTKRKAKIIEKLKDFGINTLSGIISGIITNMIQGR